jgi:hypothetical protein
MLITIEDLRTTLDQLERDGATHLIAFWRTIESTRDELNIPEEVTEETMIDIIETGCGDFNAVHSTIDETILEAYDRQREELGFEEEI